MSAAEKLDSNPSTPELLSLARSPRLRLIACHFSSFRYPVVDALIRRGVSFDIVSETSPEFARLAKAARKNVLNKGDLSDSDQFGIDDAVEASAELSADSLCEVIDNYIDADSADGLSVVANAINDSFELRFDAYALEALTSGQERLGAEGGLPAVMKGLVDPPLYFFFCTPGGNVLSCPLSPSAGARPLGIDASKGFGGLEFVLEISGPAAGGGRALILADNLWQGMEIKPAIRHLIPCNASVLITGPASHGYFESLIKKGQAEEVGDKSGRLGIRLAKSI